jgi:hypothetical protein
MKLPDFIFLFKMTNGNFSNIQFFPVSFTGIQTDFRWPSASLFTCSLPLLNTYITWLSVTVFFRICTNALSFRYIVTKSNDMAFSNYIPTKLMRSIIPNTTIALIFSSHVPLNSNMIYIIFI